MTQAQINWLVAQVDKEIGRVEKNPAQYLNNSKGTLKSLYEMREALLNQ